MNEKRPARAAAGLAGFVAAADRARSRDPRRAGRALPRSAEPIGSALPVNLEGRT